MRITLWGVRGSIPTPGPSTARYGGNTTCLSVELDDRVLVIDAGTGIRSLGLELADQPDKELFLLLTHPHNDHIQGLPFFAPFYQPGRRIHVLDHRLGGTAWSPLSLFDGYHMPVRLDELASEACRVEERPLAFLRDQGFDIRRMAVNHPGGAYGYRIEHEGRAFVFLPDNELLPPGNDPIPFRTIATFAEDADVLCHDAQYLDGDLPYKWGWGHSRVREACALAEAAEVVQLWLTHHDPTRDDEALDQVQQQARILLDDSGVECRAAHEGLSVEL